MHDHVRLCSSASPSRKRTNGVALRRLDGVASRRLDGVSLRSLDGVSLRRLDGVSLRSGTDRAVEFIARAANLVANSARNLGVIPVSRKSKSHGQNPET